MFVCVCICMFIYFCFFQWEFGRRVFVGSVGCLSSGKQSRDWDVVFIWSHILKNVHKVLWEQLTDFQVIFWGFFLPCKCYCLLANKHLVLWTSWNISHFDYCCWFEVGIRSKAGKRWATVNKSWGFETFILLP